MVPHPLSPLLALLVLAAMPAFAADAWQEALDAWRLELGITGAQATVITSGGEAVSRTSGLARAGVAIEADTVFETGSITKTYTATLALRLVEQGVLSLEDTVADLVPDTKLDPRITLRQLLNHTSGLYNASAHPGYLPAQLAEPARVWNPADHLAFLEAPYFEPGAGWRYSNTNYIVAGMMIEAASGETVEALMQRELFEPAALRHTLFGAAGPLPARRAHPHIDVEGDDAPEDIGAAMPATAFLTSAWTAGAVMATSADLATWMRRLHSGGVLAADTYQEMTSFVERPDGMQYGLGVLRMTPSGETWLGHKGNSAGFSGAAWHLPDAGITIAVLTNAHMIDVQPISDALAAIARGVPPALPAAGRQAAANAVNATMRATELAAAASSLLEAGKPADAVGVIEKAITLDPHHPDLHALLGDACVAAISPARPMQAFKLGRKAEKAYLAAIETDPRHAGARLGLLHYYLAAPAIIGGSTKKALEQAAVLEQFDKAAAWRAYVTIYTHLGDTRKSAEYEARLSGASGD